MEDPSVCRLHPGVAVTGFCPACLRDRLAGLQPPPATSADLRRCKSSSYARSAAALEPQRRSCDLFRHQQPPPTIVPPVPEELDDYHRPQEQQASSCRKSSSFLGRKLQQWRHRKNKTTNKDYSAAEIMSGLHHRPSSCDVVDPRRPSWSGAVPVAATVLASLSVEEDDHDMPPVPRSDGQIPVEEDYYYYYGYGNGGVAAAVPGGSVQTRDYYLDSSSRRRRSVDRSATSGRNSFSDASNMINGGELPMPNGGGNARVSPAVVGAERLYHHHYHEAQSVLVHQYLRDDDMSFGSAAFRDPPASSRPSATAKKGIRGWSIWGLINKKSSRKQQPDQHHVGGRPSFFSSEAAAGGGDEYPWPELRARGYNGQMLRCNSSISARSSFSGGAAMMGGRRSISGVDFRDHHGGVPPETRRTRRRDEVLLERTRSSSSYSRSENNPAMGMVTGRPPSIPSRRPSSNKNKQQQQQQQQQHEHRRSTLGL